MKKIKKNKKEESIKALELKQVSHTRKYLYILAALAFLLFANTISNDYNIDDELVTKNHPLTSRGTEAIGEIFTSPYYSDAMGYAYGYRPIVHVSFALEHQLFGESPQVSHFFNVVLFVLAVIGFFKLLVRWAGEKQLLLAFLATLFFVVHPIHTEVVASIKNRDEILAFLFVIFSALSLEKYLEKGKFKSLIWMFVLFTLAMLSKKSAFPMAIFLPIAAVFLKDLSWKKLLLISIPLLLPAVPIAAEFGLERIVLITGISAFAIGSACAIKRIDFKAISWKKIFADERFWGSISVLLLTYGLLEESLFILFSALFVLFIGFRKNERLFLLLFILESFIINLFYYDDELLGFLLILSVYSSLKTWRIDRRIDFSFIILALALAFVLFVISLIAFDYFFIILILFPFFTILNKYLGIIYSLLFYSTLLLFNEFYWISIYMLFIAIFHVFDKYKYKTLILIIIMIICFFNIETSNSNIANPLVSKTEKIIEVENASFESNFNKNDKFSLREGRILEVAENDLVLAHTTEESVATGFSTLGEYLRLHVFPLELNFYYGFAKVKTMQLTSPWVLMSILVHFGLILVSIFQLKTRPLFSLGIIWYLLCIFLFSNWVEWVAGVVGERLAFLASAGFCIIIASFIFWSKPQFSFRKPKIFELSTLFVLVLFSLKTIVRNDQWSSKLSLMESDISHLKSSAQANNLYAIALVGSTFDPSIFVSELEKNKRYKLAVSHFSQALKVYPKFYNVAIDKARLAELMQDTSLVVQSYKQAIEMQKSDFIEPFYKLCDFYLLQNDRKNYLKYAKPLLQIDSLNVQAYNNVARGYFMNNKKDSAVYVLKKGLQKFPENEDLKVNLQIVKND